MIYVLSCLNQITNWVWSSTEIHKGNIVSQIDKYDLSFLEHATDIDIFGENFSSAFSGLAGSDL